LDPKLISRLDSVEARFEELTAQLSDPATANDSSLYQKTARAQSEHAELVEKYREWKTIQSEIAGAQGMLSESDPEMQAMAKEELAGLETRSTAAVEALKVLLLPADPNDQKNVILEIRAGTGGDEASLFAAEVFRMYSRYAESRKWKVEELSISLSEIGGTKEVVALIEGRGVYGTMKYESGVHRVQRVPKTEQQGRVHTSAITVAVLPEVEDVEVQIEAKDIRVDTFCSSGPGGQSVNTTYSAIRITHLPTNTVVSCQDEKSQIKNRSKAMRVLRARLYEMEQEKQHQKMALERKSQVGSGDRSEKIRTYNFPQNRCTDHRIGLTLHQLDSVMDGYLQPFFDGLTAHFQAEKLKEEIGAPA
jgi:peptide chain release factor 1